MNKYRREKYEKLNAFFCLGIRMLLRFMNDATNHLQIMCHDFVISFFARVSFCNILTHERKWNKNKFQEWFYYKLKNFRDSFSGRGMCLRIFFRMCKIFIVQNNEVIFIYFLQIFSLVKSRRLYKVSDCFETSIIFGIISSCFVSITFLFPLLKT